MKFNSENKMFKRKSGSEDNNPKIIEWLTTELDRGEDPKRLRKALRQQNVDPMLVDKAIKSKKENPKGRKPLYFYTAFILIIICAFIGRYSKAWRDRNSKVCHLRQICALPAEKVFHV